MSKKRRHKVIAMLILSWVMIIAAQNNRVDTKLHNRIEISHQEKMHWKQKVLHNKRVKELTLKDAYIIASLFHPSLKKYSLDMDKMNEKIDELGVWENPSFSFEFDNINGYHTKKIEDPTLKYNWLFNFLLLRKEKTSGLFIR